MFSFLDNIIDWFYYILGVIGTFLGMLGNFISSVVFVLQDAYIYVGTSMVNCPPMLLGVFMLFFQISIAIFVIKWLIP